METGVHLLPPDERPTYTHPADMAWYLGAHFPHLAEKLAALAHKAMQATRPRMFERTNPRAEAFLDALWHEANMEERPRPYALSAAAVAYTGTRLLIAVTSEKKAAA